MGSNGLGLLHLECPCGVHKDYIPYGYKGHPEFGNSKSWGETVEMRLDFEAEDLGCSRATRQHFWMTLG